MNPQDVVYVGKMCTDPVQLNKKFKNLSKVHQTYRLDGSDSDGISPLHPYNSRDYRSTSHIKLRSRRTSVFYRSKCAFSNVSQVPRGFFKFIKFCQLNIYSIQVNLIQVDSIQVNSNQFKSNYVKPAVNRQPGYRRVDS